MKKLESTFTNMVLVITIITLIAAGTLGWLYTVTSGPIELSKKAKQEAAIKEVLEEYDSLAEAVEVNGLNVYKAYKGDEFIGAAVESISKKGFGGPIRVMVGFDNQGNIVNYSVLEQQETPGLGTKMVEWFKTDRDNRSVKGKNPATDNLTVKKDGGDVDAITAATISSRAFLDAIALAYQAYSESYENAAKVDYESGATAQVAPADSTATAAMDSLSTAKQDSIYNENN